VVGCKALHNKKLNMVCYASGKYQTALRIGRQSSEAGHGKRSKICRRRTKNEKTRIAARLLTTV
jgi:hypothetical protein